LGKAAERVNGVTLTVIQFAFIGYFWLIAEYVGILITADCKTDM
jgi:hypothetical protein